MKIEALLEMKSRLGGAKLMPEEKLPERKQGNNEVVAAKYGVIYRGGRRFNHDPGRDRFYDRRDFLKLFKKDASQPQPQKNQQQEQKKG